MIKRSLVLLLLVSQFFLTNSALAGFFNAKTEFLTVKTEHFYLHYPKELGNLAQEMTVIMEEAWGNITGRLEWQPRGHINVVLSDRTDEANGLATVMPYNYILLYATPPTADSSLDHYHDYLRLLFNHELTHIVHIDMHYRHATPGRLLFGKVVAPNGATPGWMREGMAVYEESMLKEGFGRNNSDYTDMVLRTAHYQNVFPRIDQIAGLSKHFPGGTGPYLFGGKFFQWLAQTYGEERMYKFQKEYASSLWVFSLNNKARRVYGKSFYKLYKEYRAHLASIYDKQRAEIETQGLTTLTDVIKDNEAQRFFTPHPNGEGYAYYESSFDQSAKIVVVKDSKSKPVHIKRKLFGQMSFSKDGRYLAFSSLSGVKKKTSHSEVYYYDLDKKKLYRAYDEAGKTNGMRLKDPDFSAADGGNRWIVAVRNFSNTDQLVIFDTYEKKSYVITKAQKKTQFSNPRFSPSGNNIVVSRKNPDNGFRDIVVYSKTGQLVRSITSDHAPDHHPVYSLNGSHIYFSSYRSGVANIWAYSLNTGALKQVTNVLDGVFQPMPWPKRHVLSVQRYAPENSYIQEFDPRRHVYSEWQAPEGEVFDASQNIASRNFRLKQNKGRVIVEDRRDMHATVLAHQNKMPTNNAFDSHAHEHDAGKEWTTTVAQFAQDPFGTSLGSSFFSQQTNDDPRGPVTPDEPVLEDRDLINKTEESESKKKKKTYSSSYKNQLGQFPSLINEDVTQPEGAKKYKPFKHLFPPRYLAPGLVFFEDTVIASVGTGRTDPLYRHAWSAFANYRTDAAFVGGGGTYIYSRYDPLFYVGALRYAVDWGTINGVNFFEQRNQGYIGASFPFWQRHRVNVAYFYEHRSALTNLNVNLVNMKPYAGVRISYVTAKNKQFSDSISREDGYLIKIGSEITDQIMGSDAVNEERTLHADARFYLEMPWFDHHVLAVRVSGGWVWGDQQQFGVYRLGGPFGEGTGAGYSSRVFPLRGLPGISYGGDYAFLASAEYRLPLLLNVNRGIGTWPVFMNKLYMKFFVDAGDIRYRWEGPMLFDRMLVATGAELAGDFMIGYGLPISMRAGYGIILTNRDRLGTLTDALTGQSVRNGSFYFQFGSTF